MGNSMTKVGYGCDQVALVALWRKQWSSSSATDPLAPFGIVTLASGGSEGAGYHMAHMRWSQTGNYGALPSPPMPRTFLAQAYDIGDPWSANEGAPSAHEPNCSSVNPATGKFDPECIPIDPDAWAPEVRKIEPLLVNSSATPIFMGGIHPRFKHEVGRRLAVALMRNISGPTIAGCKMDEASISVSLDPTRMGDEDVLVQPFDINVSAWSGDDSSTMMVCSGQLGPALANASSCACSSWAFLREANPRSPTNHGYDLAVWYCEAGPGWKPSHQQIQHSVARHASAAAVGATDGSGLGWVPSRNPYEKIWQPATVTKGSHPHSLNVDLRSVNGSASGGGNSLLLRSASSTRVCAHSCPNSCLTAKLRDVAGCSLRHPVRMAVLRRQLLPPSNCSPRFGDLPARSVSCPLRSHKSANERFFRDNRRSAHRTELLCHYYSCCCLLDLADRFGCSVIATVYQSSGKCKWYAAPMFRCVCERCTSLTL